MLNYLYRISEEQQKIIKVLGYEIEGFGKSYHVGQLKWANYDTNAVNFRKAFPQGYVEFANSFMQLFNIPNDAEVCADVGCGPCGGVFSARQWKIMYAIDPSWSDYDAKNLVKLPSDNCIKIIEDYAQTFKLPEKADIIFSINALNHCGNLEKSVENIMSNLKPNGLFFLHLEERSAKHLNRQHPIETSILTVDNILNKYNVIKKSWQPHQQFRNGVVATIRA